MEKTPYEIKADEAAFREWVQSAGETNTSDLRRAKDLMAKAIREELTPKQMQYMTAYYGGTKMAAIASEYGVDISTVSRVIANGRRRLQRVLKYCGPQLLKATLGGEHYDE